MIQLNNQLTFFNKKNSTECGSFGISKNKIMKKILLTVLLGALIFAAEAQIDKKEATIKIVVIENGKEKVIERTFSDLSKADAEIKKFSDSMDIQISSSNGKNKIIRVDVNKKSGKFESNDLTKGAAEKRVIIRRQGRLNSPQDQEKDLFIIQKDGSPQGDIDIKEGLPGEINGPNMRMKRGMAMLKRFRGNQEGSFPGFPQENQFPRIPPMERHQIPNLPPMGKGKFLRFEQAMKEGKMNGSETIKGLICYPNKPFNGKLNVRFNAPLKGNVTISVTDVNGKEIANEQIKDFQGVYLGQIDLKKSGPGVYFVRVTGGVDGAVRRVKVD